MRSLAALSLIALVSCGPSKPAATPGAAASPGTTSPLPKPAPLPSQPPAATARAASADISEATIRGHLEFLASDAMNGRGSGTRDEWLAATYIASQFRIWGLEPMGDAGGYVQAIELGATEAAPTMTAGSLRFVHGKDMLVTPGSGPGMDLTGPLRKRVEDTHPGAFVLGPPTPPGTLNAAWITVSAETPQIRSRWEAAAARPVRLTSVRAVRLPPLNRDTATPPARWPAITLSTDAYAALEKLPDGTTVTLNANPTQRRSHTWNAIGKLTGSDPAASSEVIVLSAHLDHIGARPPQPGVDTINNGADDDASGTVAVMALAEALSKGPRPRRTIVFALFGSEESGGYGAGFFVDLPVVPLNQLVADLQFEMLARPDPKIPPNHLWLTGYERSNLGAELATHGAALVADPHPEQSFFTRSDNIRFARRGVIAHTVSSYNLHKEYHTPADEIGLVDFPYMTASIRSLLEPIRWLANSPFKPAWNAGGCPAPCK